MPARLPLYIETSFIAGAPLSVVPYFRRVCPLSYLFFPLDDCTCRAFSVYLKRFMSPPVLALNAWLRSLRHLHSDLVFGLLESYCCLSSELFSCVHHLSQLWVISNSVTIPCLWCICTCSIRHQYCLPSPAFIDFPLFGIYRFPSVSCLMFVLLVTDWPRLCTLLRAVLELSHPLHRCIFSMPSSHIFLLWCC